MTEPTLQWVALGALALVGAALLVFAIAGWLRGRGAVSREDLDARQQELLGALRDAPAPTAAISTAG